MQFVYPAALTHTGPREVVVSFRDLPECLTSGEDPDSALGAAADALAEALASRIDDNEPIPEPASTALGEHEVAAPPGIAAKAALAIALRESTLTRIAFAEALGGKAFCLPCARQRTCFTVADGKAPVGAREGRMPSLRRPSSLFHARQRLGVFGGIVASSGKPISSTSRLPSQVNRIPRARPKSRIA